MFWEHFDFVSIIDVQFMVRAISIIDVQFMVLKEKWRHENAQKHFSYMLPWFNNSNTKISVWDMPYDVANSLFCLQNANSNKSVWTGLLLIN